MQRTPWSFFTPFCGQVRIVVNLPLAKGPTLGCSIQLSNSSICLQTSLPLDYKAKTLEWSEPPRKRQAQENSTETQAPWGYSASRGRNCCLHSWCSWLEVQNIPYTSISQWVADLVAVFPSWESFSVTTVLPSLEKRRQENSSTEGSDHLTSFIEPQLPHL